MRRLRAESSIHPVGSAGGGFCRLSLSLTRGLGVYDLQCRPHDPGVVLRLPEPVLAGVADEEVLVQGGGLGFGHLPERVPLQSVGIDAGYHRAVL